MAKDLVNSQCLFVRGKLAMKLSALTMSFGSYMDSTTGILAVIMFVRFLG